jgi:hypothetical protein
MPGQTPSLVRALSDGAENRTGRLRAPAMNPDTPPDPWRTRARTQSGKTTRLRAELTGIRPAGARLNPEFGSPKLETNEHLTRHLYRGILT